MKTTSPLIALLLTVTSLPCFAQGSDVASVSTLYTDAPHALCLGGERLGGLTAVDAWVREPRGGLDSTVTLVPPGISPEPALALRLETPAEAGGVPSVRRDDLDPKTAPGVGFDELPGGVVFGRVARPDVEFERPLVRYIDGQLRIMAGAQAFLLPVESPDLLRSCLAFASAQRADHVLVDIGAQGAVTLAPEFLDTKAGGDLVRCDGVPHASIPAMTNSKSLIVDREVRLRVDPEQGSARPEASLEVRFYREQFTFVGAAGAACVKTLPATGVLGRDLADSARVAAWIGFFRWTLQVDPAGTLELSAALARTPVARVPTPRYVPRRQRTVYGGPSEVKDWMRLHRARVSEDAR